MTEKLSVSRRTVVKGIAWGTPAVAVATAIPAYAASPGYLTATGSFGSWGPPSYFGWMVQRTVTISVTFTVRQGCTVHLNQIPANALTLTKGTTNFSPVSVAGLPIAAQDLQAGPHTFQITATVQRRWFSGTDNWPTQATLAYTSDSNNGTITVPLTISPASLQAETEEEQRMAARAQADGAAPTTDHASATPAPTEPSTPTPSDSPIPTPVESATATPTPIPTPAES